MKLLEHFKELTLHPKNAKELKGLILQLAVQGKLTKQWREEYPNVEPATLLLVKIKKEKSRLAKENKVKNEKESIEISDDEIPFELPESWTWCRLIDISSINGGFAFKSSHYVEDGVRVIRISDFDEKGFKDGKIVRYTYSDDLEQYRLEPKNIIIAMTGGTVGKSYFLQELEEEMVTNQRVATIKLINPLYEAYVNCVIPTSLVQDVIEEAKNSTNDNISMSDIKGFFIPVPPLEEQKAIVSIVNKLFKEVEELEQQTKARIQLKEDFVISALQQLANGDTATEWAFLQSHFQTFFTEKSAVKKLRESILQLAVQGKLTRAFRESHPELVSGSHSAKALLEKIKAEKAQLIKEKKIKAEKPLPEIMEDEIPYELPEGWEWCRLEDLTTITGGVTKGKKNQTNLINTPYLRVANVQRGFLNLDLMKEILVSKVDYEKYQLEGNDLLMIEGGDPDKVGRCAIWSSEIPCCIYQNHVFRVRPFLNSTMDNRFFMLFINSRVTRDYYESCAKRTTNLASINKTQMRSTPIACPPLAEQKAIVSKVNALMGLCDSLEKEIEQNTQQVENLMQSCLREVFEGGNLEEGQELLGMAAEPKEKYDKNS